MSQKSVNNSISLVSWSTLTEATSRTAEIREIFFLSSLRKDFITEEEKENFFNRWTQYYFDFCPDSLFLALDTITQKTLGYLTGCEDSQLALPLLSSQIPSYPLFSDQFQQYPAHLHINLHPESRGRGIGSHLISQYIQKIKQMDLTGVHIITSPKAQNVSFYQKNGFETTLTRDWKGYPLYFMGRPL
ncbi:MAG: GNAT family N-acetyltransferase [Bdellovibrionales bacterium]|nr:GNAT family N-acetyltransferase [Bdellovibrionales bacterium]